VAVTAFYFVYTRSLGRPMYILLMFVMILLATTELGVDSWVSDLMGKPMGDLGLAGGFVLVYMQVIMMVLRFCIGPIERALKPLGVLFTCALLAAVGLYLLSQSAGILILVCATIYGVGKTFFWPVTLGLVAERFPRGGAMTLNAVSGVGMLGVGIIGSQIIGFWQDTRIDRDLLARDAKLHGRLMAKEEKASVFGRYKALDQRQENEINDRVALYEYTAKQAQPVDPAKLAKDATYQTLVRNAYDHLVRKEGDRETKTTEAMLEGLHAAKALVGKEEFEQIKKDSDLLASVKMDSKKSALGRVPILPLIMAVCYLGLIFYFKSQGGYKAIDLMAKKAE